MKTLKAIVLVVMLIGPGCASDSAAGGVLTLNEEGVFETRVAPRAPARIKEPQLRVDPVRAKGITKSAVVSFSVFDLFRESVSEQGRTFDVLTVSGCAASGNIGKPAVPVKSIYMEIPPGHDFLVTIARNQVTRVDDIYLLPAQEPMPETFIGMPQYPEPLFAFDQASYQTDRFYPLDQLLEVNAVNLRNHTLLEIRFTPVRFNPVQRAALISSTLEIKVDLTTEKIPTPKTPPGHMPGRSYDRGYRPGVFSFIPGIKTAAIHDTGFLPETYMILVNDQFSENRLLESFIQWKRRKGYRVVAVKTSQIPSQTQSGPSHDEIVDFMRSLDAAAYPAYLLIIGDHQRETGVEGFAFKTKEGGYSDLYIACRDEQDHYPDLFYGRLPATNNEELDAMLDRVSQMDRKPPLDGMYNKILVAGQIQDREGREENGRKKGNQVADRNFCETLDAVAAYFEGRDGYQSARSIINPNHMPARGRWNDRYSILWTGEPIGDRVARRFVPEEEARQRISRVIEDGVSIVLHRDHGTEFGWSHPRWDLRDVVKLENGNLKPLIFSINCLTGRYNREKPYHHTLSYLNSKSFAKELMLHQKGGAYAVIAATDVSYSPQNDYLTHGFFSAFLTDYIQFQNESTTPQWSRHLKSPQIFEPGKGRRLGEILDFGKRYLADYQHGGYVLKTYLLFHLFGDPEAHIQLHPPATQDPRYDNEITTADAAQTIEIGNIESGAMVSLCSEAVMLGTGEGIHQTRIAEGDSVAFQTVVKNPGKLLVTVTRFGKYPYEGSIDVAAGLPSSQSGQLDGITPKMNQPARRKGDYEVIIDYDKPAPETQSKDEPKDIVIDFQNN